MEKLTKKERHEIYKEVLQAVEEAYRVDDYKHVFICLHLEKSLIKRYPNVNTYWYGGTLAYFPEFESLRSGREPEHSWWPKRDMLSRLEALETCIEKTKPDNSAHSFTEGSEL